MTFQTKGHAMGTGGRIQDNVKGIGFDQRTLNESKAYGSNNKVSCSVNFMYYVEHGTFAHELLHSFDELGKIWREKFHGRADHWYGFKFNSSAFSSYHYCGPEIEYLGEGKYFVKSIPSIEKYNMLELYLMGLADIDEVDFPITYLVNAEKIELITSPNIGTTFYADSIGYVTKEMFIEALGERIPSYENSPKYFNSFFCINFDRFLTPVELAYFDFWARELEKKESRLGLTFYENTLGRATLSTKLERKTPKEFTLNWNTPESVQVNAGENITIINGESVILGARPSVINGDGNYTVKWSTKSEDNFSSYLNPIVSPEQTTTYFLDVSDGTGCNAQDSVTVTVNPVTGINQITSHFSFEVYPNPSEGLLNISLINKGAVLILRS